MWNMNWCSVRWYRRPPPCNLCNFHHSCGPVMEMPIQQTKSHLIVDRGKGPCCFCILAMRSGGFVLVDRFSQPRNVWRCQPRAQLGCLGNSILVKVISIQPSVWLVIVKYSTSQFEVWSSDCCMEHLLTSMMHCNYYVVWRFVALNGSLPKHAFSALRILISVCQSPVVQSKIVGLFTVNDVR